MAFRNSSLRGLLIYKDRNCGHRTDLLLGKELGGNNDEGYACLSSVMGDQKRRVNHQGFSHPRGYYKEEILPFDKIGSMLELKISHGRDMTCS